MMNVLSEGVEDYCIDGKRILIDSDGNVAILNPMADIVLKQIECGTKIKDIIQKISEDYVIRHKCSLMQKMIIYVQEWNMFCM